MMKWILLLVALLPSISIADTHLIITIGSRHSEDTYANIDGNRLPLNENNFGLGVGYDINNNVQVRGGFYENSYNKTSWYAGASLHTDITKMFAIGVQGGLISGYKNVDKYNDYNVLRITALPFLQLRYARVAVEVGYVPAISTNSGVVTSSVIFRM